MLLYFVFGLFAEKPGTRKIKLDKEKMLLKERKKKNGKVQGHHPTGGLHRHSPPQGEEWLVVSLFVF